MTGCRGRTVRGRQWQATRPEGAGEPGVRSVRDLGTHDAFQRGAGRLGLGWAREKGRGRVGPSPRDLGGFEIF